MSNKISICVPVFNGEKYLKESVQSILGQTYEDLEILLLDDRSDDQSVQICREFAKKDPRIKVFQNEQNLGLVGNWNKCVTLATGHWIKFHFQDDLMDSESLEKMAKFSVDHDLGLVLTDRIYFADKTVSEKRQIAYQKVKKLADFIDVSRKILPQEIIELTNADFLVHNFLGEPILGLVRKEIFSRYGSFDSRLGQLVDFEFWLRIAVNEPIGFVREPLHQFRIHNDSQSSKNKFARGINQTVMDRTYLCHRLLFEDHYQLYRETTGEGKMREMVASKIAELIQKNGFFRYWNKFGLKTIRQSNLGLVQFAQALAKDLSKAYFEVKYRLFRKRTSR